MIDLDSNGDVMEVSRGPNETTKNISSSHNNDSASYDTHQIHDFSNDIRPEQDARNMRRNMMRTQNPSNRMGGFDVGKDSNAVINARQELKTEIEKKGILQEAQKQLDEDIKDLQKQIMAIEKEKFKLRLNRDSIGSQDSKVKGENDSRGTQYLRADLYGERSDDKVRGSVEKSLKLENTANQWLKDNKKLVSFSERYYKLLVILCKLFKINCWSTVLSINVVAIQFNDLTFCCIFSIYSILNSICISSVSIYISY